MRGSRGRTRVRRGRLGVGDEGVKERDVGEVEGVEAYNGLNCIAGAWGRATTHWLEVNICELFYMVETRQYLYPSTIFPFPLRHCPITLDSPILPFPTNPVLPIYFPTLAPTLIPMNRPLPIPKQPFEEVIITRPYAPKHRPRQGSQPLRASTLFIRKHARQRKHKRNDGQPCHNKNPLPKSLFLGRYGVGLQLVEVSFVF
jgi:hypothetical protein